MKQELDKISDKLGKNSFIELYKCTVSTDLTRCMILSVLNVVSVSVSCKVTQQGSCTSSMFMLIAEEYSNILLYRFLCTLLFISMLSVHLFIMIDNNQIASHCLTRIQSCVLFVSVGTTSPIIQIFTVKIQLYSLSLLH